mmetsp:Transcript_19965/g.59169  ORF Transcript_19965/g.59169 Transcript_19965/m.59169 type:complete len:100 (-) Transcript_19965:296-595(-)
MSGGRRTLSSGCTTASPSSRSRRGAPRLSPLAPHRSPPLSPPHCPARLLTAPLGPLSRLQILSRPESTIAVVGHGGLFTRILGYHLHNCGHQWTSWDAD